MKKQPTVTYIEVYVWVEEIFQNLNYQNIFNILAELCLKFSVSVKKS